ncbi:MAG: hypothetical protein LBE56_13335 [Tannerella sp.]|nr:hypothetical protein [Tannerella sp.]
MKHYTFILLVCLFAVCSLSAQIPTSWQRHSEIDYSQIRFPRLSDTYPVVFTQDLGERPYTWKDFTQTVSVMQSVQDGKKITLTDIVKFNEWGESKEIEIVLNGELLRTKDLAADDIESAIQKALVAKGWTLKDVAIAHGEVNAAKKIEEDGWDVFIKDFIAAGGTVTSVLGFGGGAVNSLFNKVFSGAGMISSASSGDYESVAIAGAGVGPGSFGAAFSVASSALSSWQRVSEGHKRYLQQQLNRVAEIQARELTQFYNAVARYLKEMERKEVWVIRIEGSAIEDFNFDEVRCRQAWLFSMLLKDGYDDYFTGAQPLTYNASYEGVYMGELEVKITYHLTAYDEAFNLNSEEKVFSAMNNSDIRGQVLWMKAMYEKYGGNFQYLSGKSSAMASHRLPVLVHLTDYTSRVSSNSINAGIQLVEPKVLKKTPPGLPSKKSDKAFHTNHSVSWVFSSEGITYDLKAKESASGPIHVKEAYRKTIVPRGKNAIETAFYLLLKGIMGGDANYRESFDVGEYHFLKETYPLGNIKVDLSMPMEFKF